MNLVRLTPDYELTDFDCGDEQLNNFLFEDARPSLELRVANTFILEDDGRIAAYFCILNDKVSKDEVIGSRWKKIRSNFPQSKQFRSYPTIKIGRFAVSKDYRGQQVGRRLMNIVKDLLHHSASIGDCCGSGWYFRGDISCHGSGKCSSCAGKGGRYYTVYR